MKELKRVRTEHLGNMNGLIEDYPVSEHTRENGKVKVKAHKRGESKEIINEIRDTLYAYASLIDYDEIESDPDLQKEWFGLLRDLQTIFREHCGNSNDLTSDFIDFSEFKDITQDFKTVGDFVVLHGPITRAGEFEYTKNGQKVILKKDWNNLLEVHKKQNYYPVKATVEKGAHFAELMGYATNWEPNHETKQMFADVVLFNDLADVTDLLNPNGGYQVSIGFKDDVKDGIQYIEYVDHLALSLRNLDVGRCSTANGLPCTVSVKNN